jgi:hypothetical protein
MSGDRRSVGRVEEAGGIELGGRGEKIGAVVESVLAEDYHLLVGRVFMVVNGDGGAIAKTDLFA